MTADRASSRGVRYPIAPRDIPPAKVARRLHLTLPQFERVLGELQARGFPHPDPTTGMYDLVAIDAWMDARSGLNTLTNPQRPRNAQEVFGERAEKLLHG